ncbi:unnamed protein product [Toxocara canis]|uniref:SAM domain-containing protein n=1 Tax=Toxocara canis TaxID=6265 RepID=A0A183V9U9_TOXCA|nr:unnamed protein product [Toxocara canis]
MSTAIRWQTFFIEAGIPRKVAAQYAQLFVEQRIKETMLDDIDKATLIDLGITTIGDQIAILRHIRLTKRANVDATLNQRSTGDSDERRERSITASGFTNTAGS